MFSFIISLLYFLYCIFALVLFIIIRTYKGHCALNGGGSYENCDVGRPYENISSSDLFRRYQWVEQQWKNMVAVV